MMNPRFPSPSLFTPGAHTSASLQVGMQPPSARWEIDIAVLFCGAFRNHSTGFPGVAPLHDVT